MATLWRSHTRGWPRATNVRLARFASYPHFVDSYEQYDVQLPASVRVRWEPLERYLGTLPGDYDFDFEESDWDFVDEVMEWMQAGVDVPPLLKLDGDIFDGRHRAWAAHQLGLRLAPVVDISPYWPRV